MKRILFLDIDGVLNHDKTVERIADRGGSVDGFIGIDQILLKRFLDWRKAHQFDIVLSSTWRTDEGTMAELRDNGISWVDVTPRLGRRGFEIAHWLNRNPVDHFAILDDVDQFFFDQMDKLVLTDPAIGVTEENLKQVETILKLGD